MSVRKLRLGVAGLGRAFTLMLPTLEADPRIELVAAADPRAEATARFAAQFAARTYSTIEQLAGDPDVEVVYVATPHELHALPNRTETPRLWLVSRVRSWNTFSGVGASSISNCSSSSSS